ncbi:unnamed protein product [Diatraea saccharalis]|uniref:Uncharacterized protein n=1 Tax=Diatraea saccharalis TaxID=40085 RepID=A0A9N9R1A6_9NEOP|nr:unnamed protein product [Diatraea saccharalis]
MEIAPEGKNFRLVTEEELPAVADFLVQYMPESLKPNSHPYESVSVFCPSERAELVDLVTSEDVLIDLTQPLYLNFTHEAIVNRFEKHYEAHDKITGDVYVCDNPPTEATTDG